MLRVCTYTQLCMLLALLLVIVATVLDPLEDGLHAWYDLKTSLNAEDSVESDTRVVIVDIDERSLEAEGRWPWSRTRIADLLIRLTERYQVALIGMDVLFPDETAEDRQFYHALQGMPVTFAQAFQLPIDDTGLGARIVRGELQGEVAVSGHPSTAFPPTATGYLAAKLPPTSSVWRAGHITPVIDSDGAVRKIAPLIQWEGKYYEMLALSLLRQLYQLDRQYQLTSLPLSNNPAYQLSNGPLTMPVDPAGYTYIPFRHTPGTRIAYISASDVLNDTADIDALEGKVVILGSTATRLYDQIITPVSSVYPAVELHASLLTALMDGQAWIFKPVWELSALFSVILLIFIAGMLSVYYQYNRLFIASVVVMGGAWVSMSLFMWQYQQHVRIWPVLLATLLVVLIYVPASLSYYLAQRASVRALFSAYVPSSVVNLLLDKPENAVGITPEKREMTVLFADMKGFSKLAEQMPPEVLARYMKQVFDVMTVAVYNHGGTVDKYMGDALMAFWGAPVAEENHAPCAAMAALEMQQRVSELSSRMVLGGLPSITIGVGINSGEMVVGDMGSSYRRSYTVIGDSVNQAERLQQLTRKYDLGVLIGARTAALLPAHSQLWQLDELEEAELPGRQQPIKVFSLSKAVCTEAAGTPIDQRRSFDEAQQRSAS